MNIPFDSFAGFLEWLFGPSIGGFAILMWFISWALEDATWWHSLSSKLRSAIIYLGSILIGTGAYLLSLNETIVTSIEPFFQIVIAATAVWLTTQVAHRVDKRFKATEKSLEEENPVG